MTEPSVADRFAAEMGRLLGPEFPRSLGVAVSGGGDSMALLHLVAGWARPMGVALRVATVDHGLRPGAAAEIALVADEARGLGLPHDVLHWRWDGTGNLQDAARRARLSLIGDWSGTGGFVLFGHTRDDQAETVLMRLARGSGVEGLSGMAGLRDAGTWHVVRPLLPVGRAELRHFCKTLRIPYADDPSNDDTRFDRVKARRALAALAPLGIGAEGLVETAARMRRAREALARRAVDAAATCMVRAEYDVAFLRDPFAGIERDTQMRLLSAALMWVSGAAYRPRAEALAHVLDRALGGASSTLQGCRIVVTRTEIAVGREYRAVEDLRLPADDGVWDGTWRIDPPRPGLEIRALGEEGVRQVAATEPPRDRAPHAVPHALRAALPALWDSDRLVACRALGFGPDYSERRSGHFRAALIAH